jgi:hypothetical protein
MQKMTEQQKRDYKAYRKECHISNVEPVRADFLGIERSYRQIDAMILRSERRPAMVAQAATAGR